MPTLLTVGVPWSQGADQPVSGIAFAPAIQISEDSTSAIKKQLANIA
jgi:hypothetical protein